jgi:hypothetical protein
MSKTDCLVDTNILIYHTKGLQHTVDFIGNLIARHAFNVSYQFSCLKKYFKIPPNLPFSKGGQSLPPLEKGD